MLGRFFLLMCIADIKKFCCQVIATRTKIYIILEFITGGELFDKIVSPTLKWSRTNADYFDSS